MTKGLMYALPTTAAGTYLTTGTAKVQLNNSLPLVMPAWSREIVTVSGTLMTTAAFTTVEPCVPKLMLESHDVDIDPTELMVQPLQAVLSATTGEIMAAHTEGFDVHIPLQGGENINVMGQSLDATAVAHALGTTVTVSSQREGRHQYGKMGTLTAAGTTAAVFVAGTPYNIHGSEMITEAVGEFINVTPVAARSQFGWFRLYSTDFLVSDSISYIPPASGDGLSTPFLTANARPVARFPCEMPTRTTCTIADYLYVDIASSTAGEWLTGVMFYKAGRQ